MIASKKRWASGLPLRVLTPGPDRVAPPCGHYLRCGGCSLQHLAYAAQLRAKGRIVTEALRRIGQVEALVEGPEPSPSQLHYRTRATFHLRRLPADRIVAGFNEVGRPGRILDVGTGCLVLSPALAAGWTELRQAWGVGARRLPAGRELRLTLREVEQGVVLTVAGGHGAGDAGSLVERAPSLKAVWAVREDGGTTRLAGEARPAEAGGVGPLGPGAFTQVNPAAARFLVDWVGECAGAAIAGVDVLDAYAGAGAFGRALKARGAHVLAIEADGHAAAAARVAGLTVLEGKVEDRLSEALPVGFAVLNPPRSGLDAGVSAQLERAGPPRMAYVSCDPATLARDLRALRSYAVEWVRTLDMFPQTAHVECVVSLDRRRPTTDLPAVAPGATELPQPTGE